MPSSFPSVEQLIGADSSEELLQALDELVLQACEGSPSDGVKLLQDAIAKSGDSTERLEMHLIDVIAVHSYACTKPVRKNLVRFLQDLSSTLPEAALLQSLDAQLLQDAGIIPSEADMAKKIRLYNTATFCRTTKYNLLSEESEGYSKFLHALTTVGDAETRKLEDIIGTFSLDPSRCLDLAIDVLEHGDNRDVVLRAISKQLASDKLARLLGFKLSSRSKGSVDELLQCMVLLVEQGLLDIPEMLVYLPPWKDQLNELHGEYRKEERKRVQNISRIRLSGGAAEEQLNAVNPMSFLKDSLALQWLLLLGWNHCQDHISGDEWKKLCFILPHSFGKLVCNAMLQVVPREAAPWVDASMSDALDDSCLQDIAEPLSYVYESGCLGLCPELFLALCRCVARMEPTETVVAFLRDFLVPSLSVLQSNPSASIELWNLLERLPYQVRYDCYTKWRGNGLGREGLRSGKKPLWLSEAETRADKDAKYSLKRLSKENCRDMSRAIAKVCHSSPLVVFSIILGQIESYDNLVDVMVDGLRFVTPLSLDVLGFCILGRLNGSTTGVNRSLLKEDGVNVSQWLQSLETFTGAFYKTFPFMELQGILLYLVSRLKDGHVLELGILRTLIRVAGGWSFMDYAPAANLSIKQLNGRAGSIALKREIMSFGVFEAFNARASQAVRSVLQKEGTGASLLILLSQLHNQIIFQDDGGVKKPIKLIGYLVDTCRVVVAILLDFLTDDADHAARKEAIISFAGVLPRMEDLRVRYGMDHASIWALVRPLIREASTIFESTESDSFVRDALAKFHLSNVSVEFVRSLLPDSAWDHLTPLLVQTFYQYTSYDFTCPDDVYAQEIERLEKEEDRLKSHKGGPANTPLSPGAFAPRAEKEELARVKEVAERLLKNAEKHKSHVIAMQKRILEISGDFFTDEKVSEAAAVEFLTHCVYPRCMQGPDDAMFCAKFIQVLHEVDTPGFGTVHFLDSVFVSLSRSLFGLTEGEAAAMAIFQYETWSKLVSKWRYDELAFKEEFAGETCARVEDKDAEDGTRAVDSNEYRRLYDKWHTALGSVCIDCLRSPEYMHQRNGLIVLTRLVDVFPTKPALGNRLLDVVAPMYDESHPFADIRAAAQGYSMQLVKARDSGVWAEEEASAVQARQAKEQAAAAARKKKAEEQMKEISREAAKITEEIGESGTRDRRGGRREPDRRAAVADRVDDRRSAPAGHRDDDRRGQPNYMDNTRRMPPLDHDDRRGGRLRERDDEGRRRDDRASPPDHWQRDRHQPGPSRGGGRELPRGLEGRWQRGDGGRGDDTVSRKRSRPSSPEPGEQQQGESSARNPKRSRTEVPGEGGTGSGRSQSRGPNRRRGGRNQGR